MSKFSGILAQARNRHSNEENADPIGEVSIETERTAQNSMAIQNSDEVAKVTEKQSAEKHAPSETVEKAVDTKTRSSRILQLSPSPEIPTAPTFTTATNKPLVRRGRPNGKRTDPNYTQITAYITRQTHKNIKMALIEQGNGQEISEVIEECLRDWLTRNG